MSKNINNTNINNTNLGTKADLKIKTIIKVGVFGVCCLALSSCVTTPTYQTTGKDTVVVVGGGLAGLTAAYELEQSGYDVTILEASNRLGGRVYTQTFANGQIAEAGGELLDAPSIHPQMHHYVDLFDLSLTDVGYANESVDGAYYLNGKLFGYDELEDEAGTQVAEDYDVFWDELAALADLIPDARNPQLAPNAAELDAMSALQWIDGLHLSADAKTLALHSLRGEYGEPANLSLLFLAQQQKAYEDIEDDDIEINRIEGGNSELIHAFADNISGDITLNNPVTNISQTDSGVVLTTQSGSRYAADYAVVSVPATVLHNIDFAPALPANIQTATDLTYGNHNKVMLQYAERFWLKRGFNGDTISELPIGWVWEETDQQEGDAGILVTYTSGDAADFDRGLSESEIIAKRMSEIRQMYPESEGLFMDAKIQTWSTAPWQEGGYTSYSPNQVMPMWTAFHNPFGRIYFAGEHTDDLVPGYMEGAVRSGQRAADQIKSTR